MRCKDLFTSSVSCAMKVWRLQT